MTTPHDPQSTPEAGPGDALQRAIDALPAERTPPVATWLQLQQAITGSAPVSAASPPLDQVRTNRRTLLVATLGMAALLAVVLATSLSRVRRDPVNITPSALLPEERRDPRVQAVIGETRNWRAASRDSVRSMRWPREAREAVEASLAATEAALASARLSLRDDPGDAAARDAIVELRAKQLLMLQRAMTLLDEI